MDTVVTAPSIRVDEGRGCGDTTLSLISPVPPYDNNSFGGKRCRSDAGLLPQEPHTKMTHNAASVCKASNASPEPPGSIKEGGVGRMIVIVETDTAMKPSLFKRFVDGYPDLLLHVLSFFVDVVSTVILAVVC